MDAVVPPDSGDMSFTCNPHTIHNGLWNVAEQCKLYYTSNVSLLHWGFCCVYLTVSIGKVLVHVHIRITCITTVCGISQSLYLRRVKLYKSWMRKILIKLNLHDVVFIVWNTCRRSLPGKGLLSCAAYDRGTLILLTYIFKNNPSDLLIVPFLEKQTTRDILLQKKTCNRI